MDASRCSGRCSCALDPEIGEEKTVCLGVDTGDVRVDFLVNLGVNVDVIVPVNDLDRNGIKDVLPDESADLRWEIGERVEGGKLSRRHCC